MNRRNLLKLVPALAVVCLPLPTKAKMIAAPTAVTSAAFAKALWPGVNQWYSKMYKEYPA